MNTEWQLEDLSLHQKPPPPVFIPTTTNLKDLNLDKELHDTYVEAKNYLEDVLGNPEYPPNQVAQTFNTINAILKEITKTQTDVYNAERIKKLELAMIHALKLAPVDIQDAFFAEFERLSNE